MKLLNVILLICSLLFVNAEMNSQNGKWVGFEKGSTISSLDNEIQCFYYYRSELPGKQPLVISLHQWSADYKEFKNSLAPEVKEKKWNYIHPDFRGANKHIKACGSDFVIADIDDVIDWALKNMQVDKNEIYIVGASGGGYAALCSFMKSKHDIKEYSVWVPITDLKRWYFESKSRKSRYAHDIIACTCNDCDSLNEEKAIERSPLYWKTPVEKLNKTKLNIYAGIHDGYAGSVPIIHSILFYNKIVLDLGGSEKDIITDDEIIWLLTTRTSYQSTNSKEDYLGDRKVILKRNFKNVSFTLFEGAHEILTNSVF